ncbi:DUF2630 family protein [Planotetraspora thailandica]|nr:DUF2630 family protein [Planotetraspora thailandica]
MLIVDEEYDLRAQRRSAGFVTQSEHARLTDLEQMLDEC